MSTETLPMISPADYLAFEKTSERRHEYHDGVMVAMAGASKEHNRIVMALLRQFNRVLDEEEWESFAADMRVQVRACNRYFYPDLVLVEGEAQFEQEELDSLTNPCVVFEVKSGTTGDYDRNQKRGCYFLLASLRVYVIVSQDKPEMEIYERNTGDNWTNRTISGLDAELTLTSPQITLPLSEVYHRVPFRANRELLDLTQGCKGAYLSQEWFGK